MAKASASDEVASILIDDQRRSTPVVIATVEGKQYLVSMLGPRSDWVKNVEAAQGDAVLRHGIQRPVHLVGVPPAEKGADPQRVRARGDERPSAGRSRCPACRVPDDRGALSGVPDRSAVRRRSQADDRRTSDGGRTGRCLGRLVVALACRWFWPIPIFDGAALHLADANKFPASQKIPQCRSRATDTVSVR